MNSLAEKKIFITGGTGFLGSHLLEYLKKENADITALYRTDEKLKSFLKQDQSLSKIKINWVKGDLFSDNWDLKGFDYVYHLAGYVGYTPAERLIMERVNIEGTRVIVEKIKNLKTEKPRLIYLSSVVAVGAGLNKHQILDEKSKFNLSSYNFGYFETKKEAEKIVIDAARNNEIFAVALNPSTIYGPRDMLKSSRKFQLKMARGELKVCSDGGVSIVHVYDVCEALINSAFLGENGERYILSGDNITIMELLTEIANWSGVTKPKFCLPSIVLLTVGYLAELLNKIGLRIGLSLENLQVATMYHWFDSSKAQKDLNFKPRSFKVALSDSLKWAKEKELF